jgi:hypothetical protein
MDRALRERLEDIKKHLDDADHELKDIRQSAKETFDKIDDRAEVVQRQNENIRKIVRVLALDEDVEAPEEDNGRERKRIRSGDSPADSQHEKKKRSSERHSANFSERNNDINDRDPPENGDPAGGGNQSVEEVAIELENHAGHEYGEDNHRTGANDGSEQQHQSHFQDLTENEHRSPSNDASREKKQQSNTGEHADNGNVHVLKTNAVKATKRPRKLTPCILEKKEAKTTRDIPMSFFHASLHCFAAVLNPTELESRLGKDHLGEHPRLKEGPTKDDTEKHKKKTRVSEVEQEVGRWHPKRDKVSKGKRERLTMSPAVEFLDTLSWMKNGKTKPLRVYRLFKLISKTSGDSTDEEDFGKYGMTEEDPAEWIKDMLNCLSTGHSYDVARKVPLGEHCEIDRLFLLKEKVHLQCVNGINDPDGCQDDSPRPDWDREWILSLDVQERDKTRSMKLSELLQERCRNAVTVDDMCWYCKSRGTIKKKWVGEESPLPEILIIRLNPVLATDNSSRNTALCEKAWDNIEIEEELSSELFLVRPDSEESLSKPARTAFDDTTQEIYTLKGIIKHTGASVQSGHYLACIKWEQAKGPDVWFKCDEAKVETLKSVREALETGSGKGGHVYLLFYQKVRDSDER